MRLEDSSCHPVLVSLWEEHGGTILEDLYGLVGEEAERVHSRQSKRKQGFGAFLRELSESVSTAMKLNRLPWGEGCPPKPPIICRRTGEEGR